MKNDDLLDLIEARAQDEEALLGKSPKKGSVGFFCWGDAPGGIGGGIGCFHWEASRSGMIRFLRKYALAMYHPRSGLDLVAIDAEVARIADAMKEGELSDTGALEALNKALQNVVQFDWIGEYAELIGGSTEYALKLRQRFRDDENGEPITRSEKGEWLEFLDQAGL